MICPPSATREMLWTQPDPIVAFGFAIGGFVGLAWVFFFPPKSVWDQPSRGKIILVTCMVAGTALGIVAKFVLQRVC
jgi:hypothetical protein